MSVKVKFLLETLTQFSSLHSHFNRLSLNNVTNVAWCDNKLSNQTGAMVICSLSWITDTKVCKMQFTFQSLFLCLLVCVEFWEIRRSLLCLLVCGESYSGIRSPVPLVNSDLTGYVYHKTTVTFLKNEATSSTIINGTV